MRRLSTVLAALALALPIAIGAVSAQTAGTTVSKAQRAEDMVVRGEEMRKRLDDFADGVTPCPQTAPSGRTPLTSAPTGRRTRKCAGP